MAFDHKRAFSDLCVKVYDQVKTDHTSSYTTKIKGFFNNQTRRLQELSAASGFFGTCKLVVSFALHFIPFAGSLAATAAGAALDYAKNHELKNEVSGKWTPTSWTNPGKDQGTKPKQFDRARVQVQGELLISNLAQKYHDALGKYEQARDEAARTPAQFQNCHDIAAYLKVFYYWRYRMLRLKYYHDQVFAYCQAIAAHMEKEESEFLKTNAKLMEQGPSMFEHWQWHYENCKEECYWPEDFRISSPLNSRETLDRIQRDGLKLYPRSAFTTVNGTLVLKTNGPTPPPYPPPPNPQVRSGPQPPPYPPPPLFRKS
jgi:hypothetical protein